MILADFMPVAFGFISNIIRMMSMSRKSGDLPSSCFMVSLEMSSRFCSAEFVFLDLRTVSH